jgi:hypothetical protein
MQAIEFVSTPHDNVVDLPPDLRAWNGRAVRVILLVNDPPKAPEKQTLFKAAALKTKGYRFDRDEANAR